MLFSEQSVFAKRCFLLGIVACTVTSWLTWNLVKVQLKNEGKHAYEIQGGRLRTEIIEPERGRLMDCNEEILTNNTRSSHLIADLYYLQDPKKNSYGLAYSIAMHSEEWKEKKTTREQDKLVLRYRERLLREAVAETKEGKAYNLAKVLLEEPEKAPEGVDRAREKLKKLYDAEKSEEYFKAYAKYASEVIAPLLPETTTVEIYDKIVQPGREKRRGRVVLAKDLTEEKVEQIKEALQKAQVEGITFETSAKRSYPSPICATHLIGYLGFPDTNSLKPIALAGLERSLDSYLTGVPGINVYRTDNRGKIIPSADARFKKPIDGINVKLTLNMAVQTIVEQELEAGLKHFNAESGTAIIVEPKTGGILAMANRPHYNLNTFEGVQDGLVNHAIQTAYEPGSTFKIVGVTAAVDSGKLSFQTSVPCFAIPIPGSKPVSDHPRSYGYLKVYEVLKKSSNPGAFFVSRSAGWSVYKDYLKRFGFIEKSGIDLPGESRGLMQDGSNYVNFSRISFGYSLMVTPLQVAMAYAAIANDGVRMKPKIIEGFYTDDYTYIPNKNEEVCRVMKPETAKQMKQALLSVTQEGGTATRSRVEGYNVGGKTGTAHRVSAGGGYAPNAYTVSFVGMMPAENPAFVCLIVVNYPKPKDCKPGGGTVGAPIFKNIATRLAVALNIPKSADVTTKAFETKSVSTTSRTTSGRNKPSSSTSSRSRR